MTGAFATMQNFERTDLDGGCYVLTPGNASVGSEDGARFLTLIGPETGSIHMTQVMARIPSGSAPLLRAGDHDVVLFVLQGSCEVDIGGTAFSCSSHTGIYVRPEETFRTTAGTAGCEILITWCPGEGQVLHAETPSGFIDSDHPVRTVHAGDGERRPTGDRHYQLLVGPKLGSDQVTQFIGMIPQSKAPEHFHTYEEAICVLSGEGLMWAGESSAEVGPGSVIFLPIRQPHCLECQVPEGMELVGLFHPAGSPAINYKTGAAETAHEGAAP